MSKDKLFIDETKHHFFITWFLADPEENGASLGEIPAEIKGEDEHFTASRAAAAAKPTGHDPYRGFYWDTRSAAQKALTACNAALRMCRDNKPWPEWAKQALAAGWKPPKGWTP